MFTREQFIKRRFILIKVILDQKEVKFRLGKVFRMYKRMFFTAIATWMDAVRYNAGNTELIQSKFPHILNPSVLKRLQKSTAGKLTVRTGKLKFMLTQWLKSSSDFGKHYSGTTIYKMIGAGIAIRIRAIQTGLSQAFVGEIRVEITQHGRLFSRGDTRSVNTRMPQENTRTLALRFNWDRSAIKGGGKRPFLTPASEKQYLNLRYLAESRLKAIAVLINGG